MTTTTHTPSLIHAEPKPCPEWCQLDPEHGWDSYDPDTGLQYRGHAGPRFGNVTVGAQETSDGRLTLDSMAEMNLDLSPEEWRKVAQDVLAAAEWLEARA